jgi:hypothetical protein
MDLFNTDIVLLILFLFAANFIGILLINVEERFWLPGILIWMGLFVFYLILREANRKDLELQAFTTEQNQSKVKDEEPDDPAHINFAMERAETEAARKNNVVFTLLGWQSIFCFFWSTVGFAKTSKKYYRSAMIAFLLLSLLYGVLAIFT